MSYEVYVHTNKINGKVYVGISEKGMLIRWKEHCKKAKYNVKNNIANYFHRAIVKYGTDEWEHAILETVSSLEEAETSEIKWIAHYKSDQRELGYNSTKGGSVAIFTDEIKERISESVKKIMADPVRRKNQSVIMKKWAAGNPNPFLGKTHSDETKKKLSITAKKYSETHENSFAGKTHSKETKAKIGEKSKKMWADPNYVPCYKFVTAESRKKMAESKRGKHIGKISKEMILEACRECKSQKQIAEKLGCTAANISFLIRSFDIKDEVQAKLRKKK